MKRGRKRAQKSKGWKVKSSLAWMTVPERSLREGCPSSPILFNVYHHCSMEVFRARRARKALELQSEPGILWNYKVDGKVGKRRAFPCWLHHGKGCPFARHKVSPFAGPKKDLQVCPVARPKT